MKKEGSRSRFYYESTNVPETPPPTEKLEPLAGATEIIGEGPPRVDAYERVSGTAKYTPDVILPEMLHVAILRCPHPHANVRSVDTSAAEKMPGVRAVLTADSPGTDIPWPYTGWLADVPKQTTLFDKHCRYAGDEVAAIAAETPHQARDALKAIKVDYEILPFVLDEESALAPGAPELHEGGNRSEPPNAVIRRGDVDAGFAEAEIIVEEEFSTSEESHATMETHGSVVNWDGGKLTIWDPTQGVFQLFLAAPEALGLPLNKIRVICKYIGGAFGSKAQLEKHTVIAALISLKTGRPVKAVLSREETQNCCGYRPNARMTLKAGIKSDGILTALQLKNRGTHGAYFEWTDVGFQVAELYKCPNILIDEYSYYINAGTSRPFRAPGFPTCSWALEQMIDMLAERAGMDPVEFRLKNIAEESQVFNQPYTSCGLRECLTEGARQFGWREARNAGKGEGHIRRGAGWRAGCGAGAEVRR